MVPSPFIITLGFVLYSKRFFKSARGLCHFRRFMGANSVYFQEETFRVSCAPHSHRSLDNSSIMCFHQCLPLGRAIEYNCVAKVVQPIMVVILLKDTIVTLH
jgi:hypothetical protein